MKGDVVIGALVAGVVCGLVPLIYGLVKGQQALAFGGFVACIAAGFVLGLLLAVPMGAVFAWLIWRADKRTIAGRGASAAQRQPIGTRPEAPAAEREPAGRI